MRSLALLWLTVAVGAQEPERIVSMNVCTDQLVLALVPPERIASVSYLAADPRTSAFAGEVGSLHLNHGVAEEIVALRPDLVVSGSFGLPATVAVLRRLGYPVIELPMAERLDDVVANLRTLGAALGEAQRAAALIAGFEQELERLTYRNAGARPLFAKYDVNGWTTGQDSLIADVVRRAGLQMPGERLGDARARYLSLEHLLLLRPSLMDLGAPWDDPPALASATFRHPALATLLRDTRLIDIPEPLWICGTLRTLDALRLLRSARDAVAAAGEAGAG